MSKQNFKQACDKTTSVLNSFHTEKLHTMFIPFYISCSGLFMDQYTGCHFQLLFIKQLIHDLDKLLCVN